MPQTLNYNIHNILKFKIIRNKGYGLRDLINLKFSYFETENDGNPDITLNIGKFTPSNEKCYTVDHKYYLKDNYFYCKDVEGKAKWEVEIIGFESEHTIINFNGKISGFQSIMNPDFIAQNFLLRLIEYKLSEKGYFFAHSAGISKNDHAFVFAGRGGSYKTSICMDFIRKGGFGFLGDDRVILHKDKILSFPMGLHVFGFMCEYLPNENSWNIFHKVRFSKYLYNSKNIKDTLIKISEPSKHKSIFFIVKTNKLTIMKRKISVEEAVDKLIINNRLEDFISLGSMGIKSGPHLKYALAYSYIFPNKEFQEHESDLRRNIGNILDNTPLYEIEIPNNYNSDIFNYINESILALK